MGAASYEAALEMAQSLSKREKLRLIRELALESSDSTVTSGPVSILDLCGLGAEIWQQVDAQEYVRSERSTWAG